MKLDDRNVRSYSVKRVFVNSLIIELSLLEFIKVYSIFHVSLLQHIAQDFLSKQILKSRELVVIEEEKRA